MKVERRSQIADLIREQRAVKNEELMERFGISIETVRRDLDYLEQQGVLRGLLQPHRAEAVSFFDRNKPY